MPTPAILAIDQGTTNTKALLITLDGRLTAVGSVPTGVQYPRPGWAEQSGEAIRASTAAAIAAALDKADAIKAGDIQIAAIAISNQRETVLAWDAQTSAPVGPAVIWQCRRSSELCTALRDAGHEDLIHRTSGLGLDPLFSAGKLRWLLDNAPGAQDLHRAGNLRMGTVDSWLLWNLTGGAVHATDTSNASRTQLLALDGAAWSPELLALFGVPADVVPQVLPSDSRFGETRGGFAGLPDGIPIHAMMGDSHASMFGHGISAPGVVKVTLGTGSSLMCPTGTRHASTHGLSETVAWATGNGGVVHALEGNITVSGHAAAFASEMLGLADPQALTDLAVSVDDSDGVVFLPAMAGLGAPHWDEKARGMICGLSLSSKPAHIARAALEGIAQQICDVVAAFEADLGTPLASISVDGSAARSDFLVQLIADLSGRKVERPLQTELSAIGAAMMAANGLGRPIAPSIVSSDRTFTPALAEASRDAMRAQWRTAIARAKLA